MSWQKEMILNCCGLYLAALLRKPGPVSPGRPGEKPPLVIVCHGFTGSKEGGGGATAMGDQLAGRGFATLLFDFTGCGESGGRWGGITLSRQLEDLGAVVGWAREKGYRQIILNGRSFGGATVLAYAAGDRRIRAVCTWAAVARPLQLFGGLISEGSSPEGPAEGGAPLVNGGGPGRCFYQDLQRYDLPRCAARISPRPLLLIHGTADEVVPLEDARLLFTAAAKRKELVLLQGADHRFSEHAREVWQIFFSWLGELQG